MEAATVDLGVFLLGESVSHVFLIRNEGNETLELRLLGKSCQCIADMPTTSLVEPGTTGSVTLRKDWPDDRPGQHSLSATLGTNDPSNPTVELSLSYRVAAEIEPEPSEIDFGKISPGDRPQATLTILSNKKDRPLRIISARGSSPRLKIVEVESEKTELSTKQFRIELDPSSGPPDVVESIIFETDSPSVPLIEVPVRALVDLPLKPRPAVLSFGILNSAAAVTKVLDLVAGPAYDRRLPASVVSGDPLLRGTLIRSESSKLGWAVQVVLEPAGKPGRFKSHLAVHDRDGHLLAWIPVYAVFRPEQ